MSLRQKLLPPREARLRTHTVPLRGRGKEREEKEDEGETPRPRRVLQDRKDFTGRHVV